MKPILVYSKEEAERNAFTVEKICKGLGTMLVTPDYRGEAAFVVNRSNDYEIAKYYEDRGIRVFNGAQFTRLANDKQLCYDFMEQNGIEIMPTRYRDVPFVKKPKDSHGGQGVVMCFDKADYDENMVCQKPASDLGRDVRVWVLGGEIICAFLRVSDTDFRSNYCLGGRAEKYNLNEEEKSKVNRIIDLVTPLGADYYGIDFVFDNGKAVFNELEDAVGARMVYANTEIDIIGMYIDYIKGSLRSQIKDK